MVILFAILIKLKFWPKYFPGQDASTNGSLWILNCNATGSILTFFTFNIYCHHALFLIHFSANFSFQLG